MSYVGHMVDMLEWVGCRWSGVEYDKVEGGKVSMVR